MSGETNQLTIDDRPSTLEGFIGNKTVKSQVESWIKKGKFPKSILLYGNTGCGKTTLANIIANEISKLDTVRIEELDCGQYSKADIQDFVARCSSGRSLLSNRKVFILNEVQELSKAALKALLVLLEKEDSSTHYILTTMEDEKISQAIKNRCSCLKLKPLSIQELGELLGGYLRKLPVENKESLKDVAKEIAITSEGVPRSALQMMNQYLESGSLSKESILGISENFGGGQNISEAVDLLAALFEFDSNDPSGIARISAHMTKIDWNSNWDLWCSLMIRSYFLLKYGISLDTGYMASMLKPIMGRCKDKGETAARLEKHLALMQRMRLMSHVSNTIIYEYFAELLA